jgi:O-antigen/teichoic acid export membrane protein
VLSFGFTVVLAHALTVSDFGVFSVVIAIFATLVVVCQAGAAATIVKTVPEYRAVGRSPDVRRGIGVALVPVTLLSLAVAGGIFLFAPEIASMVVTDGNQDDAIVYLRILAPFLPAGSLMAVALAATRGFGAMRPTVILDSIAKPGLRFILACAAFLVTIPPAVLAGLWGAPLVLGLVLAGYALTGLISRTRRPDHGSAGRAGSSRRIFREFWGFTGPQWPAEVFQLAVLWLDIVLVSALVSSSAAGVYAAVSRLVMVGTLGLTALVLVMGPVLSALLARGELVHVRTLYRQVTVWLSAASLPVFIMMSVFGPLLVEVFGSSYQSGASILSILSLAVAVDVVAGPALLVLLMGGRSLLLLADSAAGFTVNIALNLILIPSYGITGAAIAWTVSILVVNFAAVLQIRRHWGVRAFGSTFSAVAGTAALCYGAGGLVSVALGGQDVPTLLVAGTVCSVAYLAILWRLRDRLDLQVLMSAIRRPAV